APNGSAPFPDAQAPANGTRPFDSRRTPSANGTEHGPFGTLDAGRSSEPPRHDANGTEPRPDGDRRPLNGSAPFPDQRRDEQTPANGTAALAHSVNNSRHAEVHPAHRTSTGLSADRDAEGKIADELDEEDARAFDGVPRSEPPTLASVLPAMLAAVVLTCLVVAAASSLRRWWWAGRMLSYDAVKAVDTSAV
ncbi:procyclin-like gene, putative, partial [Bodo saltans]